MTPESAFRNPDINNPNINPSPSVSGGSSLGKSIVIEDPQKKKENPEEKEREPDLTELEDEYLKEKPEEQKEPDLSELEDEYLKEKPEEKGEPELTQVEKDDIKNNLIKLSLDILNKNYKNILEEKDNQEKEYDIIELQKYLNEEEIKKQADETKEIEFKSDIEKKDEEIISIHNCNVTKNSDEKLIGNLNNEECLYYNIKTHKTSKNETNLE